MSRRLVAVTIASAVVGLAGPATAQLPHVTIETELGRITVEVDTVNAPRTGNNFLYYVDRGLYAGGNFYRSVRADNQPENPVRIAVIQGGMNRERRDERRRAIALERTSVTGLRHEHGTVSMARSGPDTASSEFFICVGDQPELDFGGARHQDGQGFAAFGRVVDGMDVVQRIRMPSGSRRTREALARACLVKWVGWA